MRFAQELIGYGEDPLKPPDIDLPAPAEPAGFLDVSTALDDLTPLAVKRLGEVLQHQPDWDNVRSIQLQLSAIQITLGTQVKVDESRLRKRRIDILPKLLELMAAESAKLAAVKMIEGEVLDLQS